MRVLVTGATGFLGGAVVRRLIARGCAVRATVRDPKRAATLLPVDVELRRGDLAEPAPVLDALSGCDALIHVAALVKRKAPRALFDTVNVASTEALIGAACERGLRVVYTSSFFALGPSDGLPAGRSPDSPPSTATPHTDYERTKRLADERLRALRSTGASLVTLYPGVLYGPGEMTEANLVVGILRDHLRGKVPGLPGGGRKRWCYAYVDDVADAHVAALDRGAPGDRLALPADNRTAVQFFEEVQRITGARPPRLALPVGAVWCAGALDEAIAAVAGREPKVTRAEALTYAHEWALDGSRGAEVLGARLTPLAEGLRLTLDWMRAKEPQLFARHRAPAGAESRG